MSKGIGDTIRVSLTVPNSRKPEEIAAGCQILTTLLRAASALSSTLASTHLTSSVAQAVPVSRTKRSSTLLLP
ncbi:MAG: hypothetical protein R3B91_00230 [Planctomycetaceae bacterium]